MTAGEQQSSYRQIIKATSLFGGVQVFQIIIQVIRSKFVALLLGPSGMGITGLLYSTLRLIQGITNFGLGTSAVKDIATANGTGDQNLIATKTIVLRRLVWITGTLGAIITLTFSRWLSQLTFGNYDYTLAFIWISVTLLFNQLSHGQLALLQGMRKLQYLAKANLTGSVLSLFTTIPLYYIWGIDGIVPVIIITSITAMALSWHYSNKVKIKKVDVTARKTIHEGKDMLNMGFMISLTGTLAVLSSYIVRIFINKNGGLDQVGLYNAGFAIINSYVGMIFTAIGTDYYPRLSAVAQDNRLCKQAINQQAEIALLIIAPILIFFLVFIKWIVVLLYSSKFIAINEMIYWASFGMLFKAAAWSIAFIILAKGKSTLFFWNEVLAQAYFLVLNLLGYYYLGLAGLGISFMIGYIIYLAQVYYISSSKFEFSFNSAFIRIFIFQFLLAVCTFLLVSHLNTPYNYILGSIIFAISCLYSLREFDNRIGLQAIKENIINRFIKK